jgi:hypothetical protein
MFKQTKPSYIQVGQKSHRDVQGIWLGRPMRIFGVDHHPHLEIVTVPIGELCRWCDEAFVEGDGGVVIDHHGENGVEDAPYHQECFQRQIVGSVAHQRHQCSCYGGSHEDSPNMTIREAAKAAVEEYQHPCGR